MSEDYCPQSYCFNPFSTGTHFYLEIYVRVDHFIDIRKALWKPQDY
ncbi:hypothetical protein E2C01_085149 [Portunus trituberculatus]|uniref:Uncharacterized protein n=1 Tax=Portunus trituberculatus TaxID=210409 RepID=A0A5B7J824_PORTR|nr:hypothetical protein [Portunus trituberculatus]